MTGFTLLSDFGIGNTYGGPEGEDEKRGSRKNEPVSYNNGFLGYRNDKIKITGWKSLGLRRWKKDTS